MPYSAGQDGVVAGPSAEAVEVMRAALDRGPALRIVQPPVITGYPGFMPQGVAPRNRTELLTPLSERERTLICALVDSLRAMEASETEFGRKEALPLLIAFEAATGVPYHDAPWDVAQ